MARLLADENIHPLLTEALRAAGHDVAKAASTNLVGSADELILAEAIRDNRILLTADKDFGLILEWGPLSGRGRVLLLRYHVLNWSAIAADVCALLTKVEDEYKKDERLLVVLSEGRYRVRHATP